MQVLGIIPARGASKRIPRKNLLQVGGKPLLAHSIGHARGSKRVTRIVVSTDDDVIGEVARKHGAEVVIRPEELSGDTATSESALLHVLDHLEKAEQYRPDLVVFLQATSPVRRSFDIDRAVEQLEREKADSLFSACSNNKLLWRLAKDGPRPVNWDFAKRKREQDFPPEFRENGSIYAFTPSLLRRGSNRLGGRISIYVMPEWTSFQVDQPWETRLIEGILREQATLEREDA